jgi:hypothetical protein
MPLSKNEKYMAVAAAGVVAFLVIRKRKMAAKSSFNPDEMNWPGSGVVGATGDSYPYGNYAGNGNARYPLLR